VTESETQVGTTPAAPTRRGPHPLLLILLLLAVVTRFYDLGDRPFHHDESIHAYQSYTLSKDGTWRYDPAYHGPFLYYANALVYKLFGATNTTARVLPALFGLILIGFAWPLARWIGKEASAAYAALVLLSPHFTYFSRFIREDLYSLVFTLGTILAFRVFLETDRARWLTLSAVLFALAGVTKENAYMTGVLFVAFGLWHFAERAWIGKQLSAQIQRTVQWVAPRWSALLAAGLVFLSIWVVFYTAFGRYPADWLAIPKAVHYWMGQHAIARIPGPWYYYFPQMLYYETSILLCAVFAFSWTQWRRDPFLRSILLVAPAFLLVLGMSVFGVGEVVTSRPFWCLGAAWVVSLLLAPRLLGPAEITLPPFVRFLAFWTVASLMIYAWAREKVPWLTVHPLLPLTILAGIGGVNLWRDRRATGMRPALAAVLILVAINTNAMFLACFRYGAYDLEKEPKHGEYLAYVQTTRDLVRALDLIEKARPRVPAGQSLITVTGESTWPLSWYLRDTPTNWVAAFESATTPIIVADWNPEATVEKQLAEKYTARRLPIRAWWFPDDFWKQSASTWLRWWLYHEVWSQIGSQDAMLYLRKDLLEGTGPLAPLQISVRDTTGRDYPADAKTVSARASGGPGSGPGEFAEPRGVAADGRGNLYVADTKNSRIQIFDGNGQFLRQIGSKEPGPGQFKEPCGVAVDSQGDIWVADTWNARVVHLANDGRFLAAIGAPENNFFGPRAVLPSRNFIYVADTGNKRVVRYDRDGNKISDFGSAGFGPGQFVEPVGLAADAAGNVYVADTGNHRIQVFDAEGKFQRQFPVFGWKDFYTEPYIAIGPSDTVFVTDSWGNRIAQYDLNGTLQRSFRPEHDSKLPTGIAIDPFGRLIVSDRGTNRLFSWALTEVLH
jgi:uncharacterized protein (TIGR03663 family)